MEFDFNLIVTIMLFVVLVSIQYSLNKMLEKLEQIVELLNLLNMKQ
jgi:hypothetical protein